MRARRPAAAIVVLLALAAPACDRGNPDAPKRREAVTRAVELLGNRVVGARDTMSALAKLPEVASGDREACGAKLAAGFKPEDYTVLGRADAKGMVNCASSDLDEPVDISKDPAFAAAVKNKAFGPGGYTTGPIGDAPAIGAALAIVKDGAVTGVLFAPISVEAMGERLEAIEIPSGAEMDVIDLDGKLVWSSAEGAAIGERPSTPLIDAMLGAKKAEGGGFEGVGGEQLDFRFRPAAGGVLRVAVGIPA